jgi:hypothetical protein
MVDLPLASSLKRREKKWRRSFSRYNNSLSTNSLPRRGGEGVVAYPRAVKIQFVAIPFFDWSGIISIFLISI